MTGSDSTLIRSLNVMMQRHAEVVDARDDVTADPRQSSINNQASRTLRVQRLFLVGDMAPLVRPLLVDAMASATPPLRCPVYSVVIASNLPKYSFEHLFNAMIACSVTCE